MANHKLRPPEFNTLCYRMSNTLNERPLGTSGADDSCISVLTPDLLLLGCTGAVGQWMVTRLGNLSKKALHLSKAEVCIWHKLTQVLILLLFLSLINLFEMSF